MAGVAAALSMGVSISHIENAVKNMPPIPGRMELISCDCLGKVFVDYAHSPDAYEKLFSSLSSLTSDEIKLYTVFGCGGDRDSSKRSEMAKISEKYSTFSFVTMDNPRNEDVEIINADIIRGFSGDNYTVIQDRKEAITTALNKMDENSILLILGKGQENFQEIGSVKTPYSDIEVIEEYSNAS